MKVFTDKLDIKLIRLVRAHPVLYDHNDAKYMDFNAREVAWQQIGDELKRPAAVCKIRWVNIRDVNRRILRKYMSNPNQKFRTYKYQNEMAFMRPFYRDVSFIDDFDPGEYNDNDDDKEPGDVTDHDDMLEESEEEEKPLAKKRKKVVKSRKTKSTSNYEVDINPPTEPSMPSELNPSDPIDSFLLSIGSTLRTFTAYHLNVAKSKIFAVVQQHELEQIVQHNRPDQVDSKSPTTETLFLQ